MDQPWTPQGYQVGSLVAAGTSGESWRARERATGRSVVLKRLTPGAGAAGLQALRREVGVLRALDTPFVVSLRDVVGQGEQAVLVLDDPQGGSLADLLARRRRLEPGELVTVAAPVAQALAAAHDRGIVHGAVAPARVLFTEDGMPLLAGLCDLSEPARPVEPAEDVRALGEVCWAVLTGQARPVRDGVASSGVPAAPGGRVASGDSAAPTVPVRPLGVTAPRALLAVLEAAMDPDPTVRPSAAAFAAALHRVQAAAPVRLDLPAGGQPDPVQAHRLRREPQPVRRRDAVLARLPWAGRAAPGSRRPGPGHGAPDSSAGGGHGSAGAQRTGAGGQPRAPQRLRPAGGRSQGRWQGRPQTRAQGRAARREQQMPVVAGLTLVAALLAAGLFWALNGGGPKPLPALRTAAAAAGPTAVPGSAGSASGAGASAAVPPAAAPSAASSSGTGPSGSASSGPAASSAAPPRSGPSGPGEQPDPVGAVDWTQVVQRLDAAREAAYGRGDPALLAGVYAPRSPAAAADRAVLAGLAREGQTAIGVRHTVRSVHPVGVSRDRAVLRVVDDLSAHRVLASEGTVVAQLPGRGPAEHELVLQLVGGDWRIALLGPVEPG